MRKSTPILLSVTGLLIASLACGLPMTPAPTQDMNSLGTAIMETMISAATQTAAAGQPIGLVDTPTGTLTFTPELPTITPSATLSPTPVFTATPLVPQISVSVATNCRVGPGRIYDRVGALLVGQVAEIVGRNATGNYWYIRNPNNPNGYCWLWGEYATVTGNSAALPIFTPPPTPTPMPDFVAEYAALETCTGWWVDIELSNTGGTAFESVSITVRDTSNDVVVSLSSDAFTDLSGCSDTSSRDTLEPGKSPNISSSAFTYNPAGHLLRATVTLCSGEGLNGSCLTKVIEFKP